MGDHENPQPPSFMGSPSFRLWLYSIFFAISIALGIFGILDGNKIAAINFIVSAVLGVAAGNVPRQEK
jgi:hypothetical protein|nr:MAG TPA: Mycobacterial 2 TMS Phage Holin (M2 Hol) Family [Caudoviricetes sp.]